MTDVYIQDLDGASGVNTRTAWVGFGRMGLDRAAFTADQLRDGKLPLSRRTIVVGCVASVKQALRQLEVVEPEPLDYPESLRSFLGREVRQTTMSEVRSRYAYDPQPAWFVKPVEHKRFNGHAVSSFRDLIQSASIGSKERVWVSDAVNFVTEYRYFVHHGECVGIGHYRGDPFVYPDPNVVRAMITAYADAPVAYGLDVGVLDTGQTILVEVNDSFALGAYGLAPILYARMIRDRWEQLTGVDVDNDVDNDIPLVL